MISGTQGTSNSNPPLSISSIVHSRKSLPHLSGSDSAHKDFSEWWGFPGGSAPYMWIGLNRRLGSIAKDFFLSVRAFRVSVW